jgi:hypothetical protein
VGKEKGKDNCNEDCKEKGRTHCCWKKEAFPTYESTLGSTPKNRSDEVDTDTNGKRLAVAIGYVMGLSAPCEIDRRV